MRFHGRMGINPVSALPIGLQLLQTEEWFFFFFFFWWWETNGNFIPLFWNHGDRGMVLGEVQGPGSLNEHQGVRAAACVKKTKKRLCQKKQNKKHSGLLCPEFTCSIKTSRLVQSPASAATGFRQPSNLNDLFPWWKV